MNPYRSFLLAAILSASGILSYSAQPPAESVNVAKEEFGQWSEVVDGMRGRFVIKSSLDSHGFTAVRVYLELGNLTWRPNSGLKFAFNRQRSFEWALKSSDGKLVPRWNGAVPWIFDYVAIDFWISVPADSTLRFPVSDLAYHVLHPSGAVVLNHGVPEPPPWLLEPSIKGPYFLEAKFKGLIKGETASQFIWSGVISIPPVRLPADVTPHVWK